MESARGLQDTALAAAQEPWNFGQLVQQGQPGQSKAPSAAPHSAAEGQTPPAGNPMGDKPPPQGVTLTQVGEDEEGQPGASSHRAKQP